MTSFKPPPLESLITLSSTKETSANATVSANATAIAGIVIPIEPKLLVVDLLLIRSFEDNPRKERNPQYETIRASILQEGLLSRLTISHRPSDTFFVIRGGGNTRLAALQDIVSNYTALAEGVKKLGGTPQPIEAFQRLSCDFRPWESDLAAGHLKNFEEHLSENEKRADFSFWDRATARLKHKDLLQANSTEQLSLSAYAKLAEQRSQAISKEMLSRMEFVITRLSPVGERLPNLLSNSSVIAARTAYQVLSALYTSKFRNKKDYESAISDTTVKWAAAEQSSLDDLISEWKTVVVKALGVKPGIITAFMKWQKENSKASNESHPDFTALCDSITNQPEPNIVASTEQLRAKFGAAVNVKQRNGKGMITLAFASIEECERLVEMLCLK